MPRRAPCAVFALMLVACASCRDQPAEPAGEGSVVHTVVQAHIASAQVTRVVVTITPADVSQDLAYDAATSMFTGTVAVAAGDQTVRADAYAGATLVGSGSAPVTVAPNRTGQVLITIPDASGPGSVPDHSPVVTTLVVPSTSVAPGGQLALSATAFDADGDPIASAWSAAPAGCGSFASPASLSTTFTAGGAGLCTLTITVTARALSDARSAAVTVQGAAGYSFPLKVSPNGRYLTDSLGAPFRIHGEAAWSAIANLSATDQDAYLADRQAKGVNLVLVNLFEHYFATNAPNTRTSPQIAPFTTPGDFRTLNPSYMDFAVAFVDKAAAHGIVVMLDTMYLGNLGGAEGWWSVLANASNTQPICHDLGLAIAARLKDRGNLIWVFGGDYSVPSGSEGEKRLIQIYQGVRDGGATQLATSHWASETLSSDQTNFRAYNDLVGAYSYGGLLGLTRSAYGQSPTRPAFLMEGRYENERFSPNGTRDWVRGQMWQGYLGSIAGALFGSNPIWEFGPGNPGYSYPLLSTSSPFDTWQHALQSPGALDWQLAGRLLDGLPWHRLHPEGLGGVGTVRASGGVTAAVTPEGDLALVYVSGSSVTVNRAVLSAPFHARWWNPTSGAFTEIGSGYPNTGTQVFTTPGSNGAGASDWVLVLDLG